MQCGGHRHGGLAWRFEVIGCFVFWIVLNKKYFPLSRSEIRRSLEEITGREIPKDIQWWNFGETW
jgi:hypothetical protein